MARQETTTATETSTSYVSSTLKELGITDEHNKFTIEQDVAGSMVKREQVVFKADEEDNLLIHYYNLRGLNYTFRREGNKWPINFIRKRYRVPLKTKEGDEIRYISPQGSGMFPFFPPTIIKKFLAKDPIPLLIITEGEKKAFKGCLEGLDVVGIPSIHGFYDGDIKGKLHEDLQELIIGCKVEKIIFLTDADTLTITWKKDKDLYKRINSFYTAIKLFRESLQLLLDGEDVALSNIYFSHIVTKYKNDGKGLDDLLVNYTKEKEQIFEDLNKLQFSNKYFSTKIITDGRLDKVYKYLGLYNEDEFYNLYKEFIGSREFLFRGRRYEWDGEKVKYVRHEDADKYMRVGADWAKIIRVPNKYGELEEDLISYKIGEIQRDYKRFPDFIEQIPKYDAFCNEPAWNDNYKRVHNGCYNLVNPLNHVPAPGSIANTVKFLKHVFQGEGSINPDTQIECCKLGDQFTVALDYLTIAYKYPKHMLPVPILVSKENRTGKSTFLKWLQAIFESNMAILGNEQFKMKFNGHYINKFFIAIDEGFLEVDKKAEKERLKQLATADTAYLENKGMNVKKIQYYGKLIICSNDADSVMKIEEEETRWFVVKVPQIADSDVDPDLELKMKEEIPAWLHYIANREIFHPRTDRLWFKTEWFITDQFREIVENTKSIFEKEFNELISNMFLTYKIRTMMIDLPWLVKKLNEDAKYRVNKIEVKKFLKDKKKMKVMGMSRCLIPIGYVSGAPDPVSGKAIEFIDYATHPGRPYEFKIEDWASPEDIRSAFEDLKNTNNDEEVLPF